MRTRAPLLIAVVLLLAACGGGQGIEGVATESDAPIESVPSTALTLGYLLPGDETDDEALARQTAERLIGAGVQAVVGAAMSQATLATLSLFSDSRVIMCSGSNTAPALSTDTRNAYFFRTASASVGQTSALAQRIVADGRASVAILSEHDRKSLLQRDWTQLRSTPFQYLVISEEKRALICGPSVMSRHASHSACPTRRQG